MSKLHSEWRIQGIELTFYTFLVRTRSDPAHILVWQAEDRDLEDWPVIVRQPWLRLNKHGHDHNAEDGDLEDQLVIIRQPWLRLNEQDGDLED
jgi:hypothetical protein